MIASLKKSICFIVSLMSIFLVDALGINAQLHGLALPSAYFSGGVPTEPSLVRKEPFFPEPKAFQADQPVTVWADMPENLDSSISKQTIQGVLTDFFGEFESTYGAPLIERHKGLLQARSQRQKKIDQQIKEGADAQAIVPKILKQVVRDGGLVDSEDIAHIEEPWIVQKGFGSIEGDFPEDMRKRWAEVTGPAHDPNQVIYRALGAKPDEQSTHGNTSGYYTAMEDIEDSMSPTWGNVLRAQHNLKLRLEKSLQMDPEKAAKNSQDGKPTAIKDYGDNLSTMMVRVRGWQLFEEHVTWKGQAVPAGVFDFLMHMYLNQDIYRQRAAQGLGAYFYLPKMEHFEEAKLWNDIFNLTEKQLGLPHGSIKATVMIETLPAGLQMREMIWALKDHIVGLNAGRWDYIFSAIKVFMQDPNFVFPDRSKVTMLTDMMNNYANRLVYEAHRAGIHAIGGMAAQVMPSLKGQDEETQKQWQQARQAILDDKTREKAKGFDGSWGSHPQHGPIIVDIFKDLGGDHQISSIPKESQGLQDEHLLLNPLNRLQDEAQEITSQGLGENIAALIEYYRQWLSGVGAVNINGRMEDAATAEISRSQVYQWLLHNKVSDKEVVNEIEKVCDALRKEGKTEQLELAREHVLRGFFADYQNPIDSGLAVYQPFATLDLYQEIKEPVIAHDSAVLVPQAQQANLLGNYLEGMKETVRNKVIDANEVEYEGVRLIIDPAMKNFDVLQKIGHGLALMPLDKKAKLLSSLKEKSANDPIRVVFWRTVYTSLKMPFLTVLLAFIACLKTHKNLKDLSNRCLKQAVTFC